MQLEICLSVILEIHEEIMMVQPPVSATHKNYDVLNLYLFAGIVPDLCVLWPT